MICSILTVHEYQLGAPQRINIVSHQPSTRTHACDLRYRIVQDDLRSDRLELSFCLRRASSSVSSEYTMLPQLFTRSPISKFECWESTLGGHKHRRPLEGRTTTRQETAKWTTGNQSRSAVILHWRQARQEGSPRHPAYIIELRVNEHFIASNHDQWTGKRVVVAGPQK